MSHEKAREEALKLLRTQRAETVKRAAAQARLQKQQMGRILAVLAQGPATPPQVAQAAELPPGLALWYLAAMRKYGQVIEAAKQGDYFSYRLAAEPAAQRQPEGQA